MALTPGSRLGPYEVLNPIGAGGMGEVYRARDTRLGREVAVKVLPSAFAADNDRMRRFEQEARTVAALNHPNILALRDIGPHEGARFSRRWSGLDVRRLSRRKEVPVSGTDCCAGGGAGTSPGAQLVRGSEA